MEGRLGRLIAGRYRLEGVLGEGAFGAVYDARDEQTGERVAVKVLHAHLTGHREFAARFRREALAVTRLGHPNIVRALAAGDDGGESYLVMERLQGRDGAQALAEDGPFSLARAVHVVSQICRALQAAHEQGIVHRDLKLDNLLLTTSEGDEDFVKVLDFGVSKFLEGVDSASLMTRSGVAIGTPFYMAPEQAQGRKDVDHRADIYAIGVILFRLLTGQHPFEDSSYPMLVLKICTEPPPPVGRFRADVPPVFEAAVQRALAKLPEDRYASCREFEAALAPFAAHDAPPELLDAPSTSASRAAALAQAPTALSIDRITGRPLSPALEEGAVQAEQAVRQGVPGWRLGAFLLLLAVVGTAVWWVSADVGGEAPEARPGVSRLPRPRPPVIRPMRVPEGMDLGWRWVNPLPRAMRSWNDVAVGGPGLVAMVGDQGSAARWRDGALAAWPTGVEADLQALEWIGPAQALAVGDSGTVVALLMSGARTLHVGTEADLRDVAALGPTDAIVVGDEGTILRLQGFRPQRIEAGRSEHFFGVHAVGDRAWVVGQRGIVVRVEGDRAVVEREPNGASLRAVGGCGPSLYAAGDGGRVLRRGTDGRWAVLRGMPREDWTGVACDGGRVVLSGSRGGVLLVAGERGVRLESGGERGFRAVDAAEGAAPWLVGDGGLLARLEGDHLVLLTSGPTETLFDLATLGGRLVAVGRWGTILRYDGQRLTRAPSPTDAALTGVAALSPDRLLAVGDHGTLVEIRWDAAALIEGPREHSWRDVVAAEGVALAVGTGGALLRGAPGAWAQSEVSGGGLWAVAGTPDDALAVGDEGQVWRVTLATAERRATCGVQTLRGVWRDGDEAWIVGDGGSIWRLRDEGCEREESGVSAALHGVGPGPRGRPMVVGEHGVALERGADGSWTVMDIGTDLGLYAVHATDRDVFVVGAGGVVLRHPRLAR